MVRADESALSFFRRKLLPKIHFQQLDRIDSIEYGQCYEIQINPLDISQGVLSLIFHFLISAEKGHVYHFSTADNLYYSLQQSGLDLSGSPAARANTEGRFLAGSVYSCQQITEFFKLISTTGSSSSNTSTDKDSSTTSSAGGGSSSVRNTVKQHNSNSNYSYEPTLVILEALSPILISEKTLDGRLPVHSPVRSMFKAQAELLESQNIIIVWVTALCRRHEGALRDMSRHDELSTLWRQQIPLSTVWRTTAPTVSV